MAQSCTYTFNGPDGKEVTIRGMAAMKAYLVDGGMEFFQTKGVRFEGLEKAEAKPAERIADLGEKIGGARKDTSQPTGRTGKAKTEDERPAWARRFEISQIVDIQGLPNGGKWIISDKRNLDWRKQPNRVGGFFDTQQEAEAAIPLVAVGLKHRVVPARDAGTETKWEIWRDVTDRKRVKVVERSFDSRDEAMRYMAEHATEIIETNTTFGEADLPKPDNVQRIGEVRRKGDVNGDNFMEAFGFRGVEFGNWNNQEERQQVMNEAYDGLLDLAEVLGIPPKAISLNGDLALAFGARGQGLSGARAHYEPAKAVINLTKMNGAGALAHEWFHALDHYLARQDGKALSEWVTDKDGTRSFKVSQSSEDNMASGGFRYRDSGVREEVRAAYKSVMDTMANKAEQYVEDSARAEKFVAATRKNVSDELASIRKNLSEQLDPRYYKRNNKPASAELLAEFDTIAEKIVRGESLDTDLRSIQNPKSRSMMAGMRLTNDALERINAIYKEVRGRSGFNAERNGFLDRLRSSMQNYQARLKMLAEAQQGSEKERKTLTDFRMDAKSLDQGRGTDYWATPHELAARAFQGYVEDKIAEKGGRSPFLNYAPENVAIYTPWGWKRPYPAGAERKAINAAFDNLASVFKTKETDKGVALFRTTDADPSNQRITRAQADGFLAGFLAKYANAPQITLVNTFDQLPATVQQEARNQGGNASDTKGVFHRGQVYLVAGNHSTVADFEATVFHEVIGHAGVRALFGPDFVKTANRLFMQLGGQAGLVKIMQRRGMGQQASDYIKGISQAQRNELNQIRADMAAGKPGAQRRWNDAIARFVLTEEVFAHIAEQVKDRPSMMDKMKELIGKIRQWLRDKGFAELSNLGETDILFMLSKARQNMQGKDGNITRNGVTVSGNDLMTSDGRRLNKDDPDYASAMRLADLLGLRQEQGVTTFRSEQGTIEVDGVQRPRTNSESRPIHPTEDGIRNFWRWFKDSKVVDADGKPLVMYHGTKADFSAFEMRKAGTSDDGLAGKGFYFTYNPEEASGYAESGNFGKGDAPNVQPVYVSLNNPLRIEKGVLPDGRRVMDVHKQYGHGINAKGGDAVRNLAEEAGHDGVVWVRTDGGVGHAVAFRPNQIKSATGNTGAFDPNEAPITLRRAPSATQQQGRGVRDKIADTFRAMTGDTARTFNWWNRTIGSQYNKAKKSPEFKKVYDRAHDFIDDVSRFANEAADRARNILPHLDTWKDIGAGLNVRKAWADAKDYQAIAPAIFEGTLANGTTGKVWSDEELSSRFNLNEKQKGLYREFRDAVNFSLDTLAKSEMTRAARAANLDTAESNLSLDETLAFYVQQVDDQIAKADALVKAVKDKHKAETDAFMQEFGDKLQTGRYRKAVEVLVDRQRAEMEEVEKAGEGLDDLRKSFTDKAERIQQLKDEGYAPLMRFGQYTVDVVRLDENGKPVMNDDGEQDRPFFGMFESESEAREAAQILQEEYPDYTVTRGVLSDKSNELFKGITPETAELFAKMLGTSETEGFQAYLKQAVANRSAMKRLIQRKGLEGFSTDVPRVLASFITSNARLSSGNLHFGEMAKAVADIPKTKGDVADEAIKLMQYIQNPQEEAAALRGLLFFNFLGGSVAAALVNTTQTMTTTLPYLNKFGPRNAASAISKAMLTAANAMRRPGFSGVQDTELRAALQRASEEGIIDPQEIHLLMAESMGNGASSLAGRVAGMVNKDLQVPVNRFTRSLTQAWGGLFSMAEKYNRHVAFMAAWDVAGKMTPEQLLKAGAKDRFGFAKQSVIETQFEYNKVNRPNWARGAVGATLFTFKTFLVNYLEFIKRLPSREKALAVGVLFLLSGMSGAPGADDLDDLIDSIGQKLGYNWNNKAGRHAWLMETFGKDATNFIEHGVSSFLPIDVSARLGMGNIIPGTGIFKKSEDDKTRDVAEFFGPAGSLAKGAMTVFGDLGTGKPLGELVRPVMPKAYNDAYQAIDVAQTGYYRDSKGRKVVEADGLDAIAKAIGFQPNAVAEPRRVEYMLAQSANMVRVMRADIHELWARGVAEGDREKVQAAQDMLREWNEKNRETPIRPNLQSIQQRVRAMRLSSAERLVKATPKEMRGMVSANLVAE